MIAILDIDGTLVDTNYHHALAWYRAFRDHDLTLPLWRIHRSMGMGGDQLVVALAGEEWDERHGDGVRAAEKERYLELIEEVEPLPEARRLLEVLSERGHSIVLASSAKQDEVDHYLDLLDARELADSWTTSADVDATKPEPDLIRAALEQGGGGRGGQAVLIGDSTYDCEAAARAGVATIAVRTGGFADDELRAAGAAAVYISLEELIEHLDDGPLGDRSGG
ncbi:MAG: HAD family hydrolase [Thermoleophilaceae bacterium]